MTRAALGETGSPTSGAPDGHDLLLLLPSTTYSDGVLDARPFIRYYGERCLSDLAALRNPCQRIVLVTAEEIDPWILDRTIDDLSEGDENLRADMRGRLECAVVRRSGRESLADAVLADSAAMRRLRDAVGSARAALIVNFSASSASDRVAAELGVAVEEGPAGVADRWGTKAGSKTVFREAEVLCPPGDLEVVRSVGGVTRAALRLATRDPPCERVIVKLDAAGWSGGKGNAVVHGADLLRTNDLRRSVESLSQPWETYVHELCAGGAIVEGYVEGASAWPSAQGRIDDHGGFELLAMHEQILVGDEYWGCRFPVGQNVAEAVAGAAERVGATLARHGVHGSFGVDFVVAGERTYATEINLRKVGPSHVIKAVHARGGAGVAADGRGAIMGMPVAYVNRRLRSDLLTTMTPPSALAALDRAGLGYERATGTGVLLHVMGALAPVGFVETTSLARSADRADELDRRAEEVLMAAARHAREASLSPG